MEEHKVATKKDYTEKYEYEKRVRKVNVKSTINMTGKEPYSIGFSGDNG